MKTTKDTYAKLFCTECEEIWDINFENMEYPPADYAMAIEQKIGDGCPDCHGELRLIKEANQ